MEWARWEPTYRAILHDLGYSRAADEDARDLAAGLARTLRRPDMDALRAAIAGTDVVIAGPWALREGSEGPKDGSAEVRSPSGLRLSGASVPRAERPWIATDASTWAFDRAIAIVTDLDGDVDAQAAANARGVPMFVHAHGDNAPALRAWLPRLRGPVQPTTQAEPRAGVVNYGGFTDGDRACCLAAHLGARSLILAGFDFERAAPKPGRDAAVKLRKLAWARRIVDALDLPARVIRP